ncbi:major facilitator superfamily domain-containing protein [Aspergillus pseudodeflectus]|uniref:Major facilitator superfamily domain-containing protein n=1 Tax=Aspergillus pseudodeflectus TaxID=176178 RepID=A0ABR4L6Y9_9EURO
MEASLAQPRLPGTVKLIDAQGLLNVKHGHGSQEIILVPQPTDDPDDPLRWSKPRKMTSIISAMAWCFFIGTIISGLSPAYILIEKDTGISIADLSTGNGILYLFMGWGTMITQSLALKYGRRLVLVGCIILVTAVTVWTAYVQSRGEFFVNRILLGIFASPQETLIEMIIGDMFFTHDRGFYMGAYSWSLFSGALLSPVASGYVAQYLGWQWIQYILAIIGAAVTVLTFFFFEETMFFRDHLLASTETLDGISKSLEGTTADDVEKTGETKSSPTLQQSTTLSFREAPSSDTPRSTRPYIQKLKLWGYQHPLQPNPFKVFFLPIKLLFAFPAMFFSGLLVGGTLAWYNAMSGSMALILGEAPYNFSTNTIGLTYLACFVGVTIGCCISGWMSDVVAIQLASRNGGIMEPEQRLWICLVALVVHPAGCLLYGVGASYGIHWGGIVVGLGLIAMTFPLGACLAYTYVLDSYREMAGEGLVSVILIRNMMGFAFGYAVVPMINALTVRYAFVLIALLGELVWLTGMAMIYFGKPLRRNTAQKYWNLVEKTNAKAH